MSCMTTQLAQTFILSFTALRNKQFFKNLFTELDEALFDDSGQELLATNISMTRLLTAIIDSCMARTSRPL